MGKILFFCFILYSVVLRVLILALHSRMDPGASQETIGVPGIESGQMLEAYTLYLLAISKRYFLKKYLRSYELAHTD